MYKRQLYYREGIPLSEAYKRVLGKEYEVLRKHEDFIEAPLTDYYVDVKSTSYKAKFEKVIKELGINRDEVITWLKKKKIIQ